MTQPSRPRKKSATGRPARTPKPESSPRSWWATARLLALGVVLLAVPVGGYFFYVTNSLVLKRLEGRQHTELPVIIGAPFRMANNHHIPRELIQSELDLRSYRQVDRAPSAPGEYSWSKGYLEVHTRSFTLADGRTREAFLAKYDPVAGEVFVPSEPELATVALEGVPLTTLGGGDRRASRFTPLEGFPPLLPKAVLAIEDERFHDHMGIDVIGLVRAMYRNIMARRLVQGGSTLTQQLAKNLLFGPERTLSRKVREAAAALVLEHHLTKDLILELYLNEVFLGQEGAVAIHGFAEGAVAFFNKPVEELSLSQIALLAGVIKAPSSLSPRRHLDKALERRDVVLEKMTELGYIDTAARDAALAEKITVAAQNRYQREVPHFMVALTRQLHEQLGTDPGNIRGLKVYSGIEPELQRCAETALTAGVEKLEKTHKRLRRTPRLEAGLIAIEPVSGMVRAWVGGRAYERNQFDHVSQARRQLGSTIKPFVYLTALDPALNDYYPATPLSILLDEPHTITIPGSKTWTPENYDHRFRGRVTFRYALENSLNAATVYLAQRIGIDHVAQTLLKFRVSETIKEVPSLVLGSAETSLLELTTAYAALANGGIYTAPRLYASVQDGDGETLAVSEIVEERVADEAPVYVLTNIMQGVLTRGTAASVTRLGYKSPAAGKTGTSNELRDAWFIGFTPELAAGVWVGFDDNHSVGLTGGAAAAPIWAEFMKCAEVTHPSVEFLRPPGVALVPIDPATRLQVNPRCPPFQVVNEIFVRGTEPPAECPGSTRDEGIREPVPPGDLRPPRRRSRSFWSSIFGD